MSSRQRSPARGASPGATSEGARPRLTRTQGRKVWPSSSAHARRELLLDLERPERGRVRARQPQLARDQVGDDRLRAAHRVDAGARTVRREHLLVLVVGEARDHRDRRAAAARGSSAPRSSVPGFCTLPHDAPAGDMLISTPTGASVVAAPTSTPSVARHASAACRWRVRSSGSIAASSSSPTRWLVAGRKPQRPAANSSSAYPRYRGAQEPASTAARRSSRSGASRRGPPPRQTCAPPEERRRHSRRSPRRHPSARRRLRCTGRSGVERPEVRARTRAASARRRSSPHADRDRVTSASSPI